MRAESDNFESAAIHPVELAPDGARLYVAHLAGNEVVVFDLASGEPERLGAIPVGLDPVAVRARTPNEVWVVNHLSDSVSLIDPVRGIVTRTLLVGDAPTDVVFAGGRAFVCVSGRSRIAVYDPSDLDLAPIEIPLEANNPLALAVSPNGDEVYVCARDGGNQTTVVPYLSVVEGGGPPPPHPPMRLGLPIPPRKALIVKHDGTHWVDEIGRNWDPWVPYRVLDHDVLAISSVSLSVTRIFSGVGTTLLGLAVDRSSGRIYVSNQETRNEVRFVENLKGRFLEDRVSWIDPASGLVAARPLNPQIDYSNPEGNPAERALSLALPMQPAVRSDGSQVFVAAFGSHKVAVLDHDGSVVRRIPVGQGPAGLALDEARNQLYVYNRFSSTLSVVDLEDDSSHEVGLGYDPTPLSVRLGRRYLYDGEDSSAHGDLACGSCHLFGGVDQLAWDLGDPQGVFIPPEAPGLTGAHPMKGPMMTQSLKSLADTEPFHWRGDRVGFPDFNQNFVILLGRGSLLDPDDFGQLSDFVFSLRYPPNPNRNLDGSLPDPASGPNPTRGEDLFLNGELVGTTNCTICHTLPTGTSTNLVPADLIRGDEDLKVPQLRNMFEKGGFQLREDATTLRGFGYGHDGVFHDIFTFLDFDRFDFRTPEQRRDVEAYALAFDTMTPAAIGAQWTDRGAGGPAARLDTLATLALKQDIGLVAKGVDREGEVRGWTFTAGSWTPDRASEAAWTSAQLRALARTDQPVTYTAVVAGTETRLGIDRDEDGFRDRDELDAGSDPDDPESFPVPSAVDASGPARELRFELVSAQPALVSASLRYTLPRFGALRLSIYDVRGRQVRRLLDQPAGASLAGEARWDLRDERGARVASGVYFARLDAGPAHATRRIVVEH